ncbi:MAG: hypothetical protein P4M15_00105 [Alphaproteobacteria bacterium]|nr:hypothetical protein [Alphaproteobacteria bacterium]
MSKRLSIASALTVTAVIVAPTVFELVPASVGSSPEQAALVEKFVRNAATLCATHAVDEDSIAKPPLFEIERIFSRTSQEDFYPAKADDYLRRLLEQQKTDTLQVLDAHHVTLCTDPRMQNMPDTDIAAYLWEVPVDRPVIALRTTADLHSESEVLEAAAQSFDAHDFNAASIYVGGIWRGNIMEYGKWIPARPDQIATTISDMSQPSVLPH